MWIEANKNRTPTSYETAWGQKVTRRELFKLFKEAGFNAIRVPVTWYPHMEATFNSVRGYNNSQGQWVYSPWLPSQDDIGTQIDATWMKRVREVVDAVLSEGMYCILNIHHDTGASNTAWLIADEAVYAQQKERFEAVWRQIAETFRDYDDHLLFEGYNEMLDIKRSWCFASFAAAGNYNATIARSAYNAINSYAQSFVDAVRATGGNNTERNLIVSTYGACSGSGTWSSHLKDPLKQMVLPTDGSANHLIFEVHSYPTITSLASAKSEVNDMMEALTTHLAAKGAPIIIGEWGSSDGNDYANRRSNLLAFARYFVEQAKAKNITTFYWMGLSDGTHRQVPEFNQPDLVQAIVKGYYGDEGYQGIEDISYLPKNDGSTSGQTPVYDLQGRKISATSTCSPNNIRKGSIYIVGGKKRLK